MRSPFPRSPFALLLVAWAGLALAGPALALEDGLMGIRIGASYRELTRRLGPPHGILLGSGGGMMYQTLVSPGALAGLPQFGATSQTGSAEMPVWVLPVRVGTLGAGQAQWFYDLRARKGVSLGIVLSGEGADAAVTDVVVAGFEKYLKGKPAPVRTQRGIVLQSSFADVLEKYGFPPLAEIYAPGGAPTGAGAAGGAARGGAMRTAGAGGGTRAGAAMGGSGMRGGMRGGMGGGMRGGMGGGMRGMGGRAAADPPTMTAAAPPSGYEVRLTGGMMAGGMRGGRGGAMGGGMRGGMGGAGRAGAGAMGGGMRGGMRGGARAGGAGALPPLGAAAPAAPGAGATVQAYADNTMVAFSRDCILTYEGIAFTIQNMKVMRIHVSE
jgi:hypothetical protein